MRQLPELTHLQYLALQLVKEAYPTWLPGVDLRQQMLSAGAGNRSLPAFYQFMSLLEEKGFVSVRRKRMPEGHVNASYRFLKRAEEAMTVSQEFYRCAE
jgi:DNA-binding PadR family transcriptional regulator